MRTRKNLNVYALYRGDKLLAEGTVFEIAEKLNIKVQTVKKYQTPSYMRYLKKHNMCIENATSLIKIGRENDFLEEDLELEGVE